MGARRSDVDYQCPQSARTACYISGKCNGNGGPGDFDGGLGGTGSSVQHFCADLHALLCLWLLSLDFELRVGVRVKRTDLSYPSSRATECWARSNIDPAESSLSSAAGRSAL